MRQTDPGRLNQDQRILYELIEEAGEISPGDLYNQYDSAVDDPKTKRMVRNYIGKMHHFNLIDVDGEGPARKYRSIC